MGDCARGGVAGSMQGGLDNRDKKVHNVTPFHVKKGEQNMKNRVRGLTVAVALMSTAAANGAGFALYQGSSKGIAMGGAAMGRAPDASANFYNPATISDFTNTVVTVGTGLEMPRASAHINGDHAGRMNPRAFLLPHAYVVQPLPWDFTFGLGFAPEFGLGTKYGSGWGLNWNTTETTVEGLVINPNLSYRITEDWSVSAGFRILYFSFDQYSHPLAMAGQYRLGQMSTHLEGDNGFADWGWQVSTRYRILDNLSAGLMYRSYIDTKVRGHYSTRVKSYNTPVINAVAPYLNATPDQVMASVAAGAMRANGDAGADIRLPQSISGGLNWDVTDTVHLGGAVTWTGWSSMDTLKFDLEGGDKTTKLDWDDVFRFGLGGAWDFAENWSLLGSYSYDMDPCSTEDDHGSTMLPAGDRHILNGGLAWSWGNFEISACYGLVLMCSENQTYHDAGGNAYRFKTTNGLSHQLGLTLTYTF